MSFSTKDSRREEEYTGVRRGSEVEGVGRYSVAVSFVFVLKDRPRFKVRFRKMILFAKVSYILY